MPLVAGPGSGDETMVAELLRKLALTKSMAAQIQTITAQTAPGPGQLMFALRDPATRQVFETIDITEVGSPDMSWMPTQIANAFTGDQIMLTPPWPSCEIIQQLGRRAYSEEGWQGHWLTYSAVFFVGGDNQQLCQRGAGIMAKAYGRLVERDESLGGLVKLIRRTGPIEEGGGAPTKHKESPVLMVARVVFEALVVEPG